MAKHLIPTMPPNTNAPELAGDLEKFKQAFSLTDANHPQIGFTSSKKQRTYFIRFNTSVDRISELLDDHKVNALLAPYFGSVCVTSRTAGAMPKAPRNYNFVAFFKFTGA